MGGGRRVVVWLLLQMMVAGALCRAPSTASVLSSPHPHSHVLEYASSSGPSQPPAAAAGWATRMVRGSTGDEGSNPPSHAPAPPVKGETVGRVAYSKEGGNRARGPGHGWFYPSNNTHASIMKDHVFNITSEDGSKFSRPLAPSDPKQGDTGIAFGRGDTEWFRHRGRVRAGSKVSQSSPTFPTPSNKDAPSNTLSNPQPPAKRHRRDGFSGDIAGVRSEAGHGLTAQVSPTQLPQQQQLPRSSDPVSPVTTETQQSPPAPPLAKQPPTTETQQSPPAPPLAKQPPTTETQQSLPAPPLAKQPPTTETQQSPPAPPLAKQPPPTETQQSHATEPQAATPSQLKPGLAPASVLLPPRSVSAHPMARKDRTMELCASVWNRFWAASYDYSWRCANQTRAGSDAVDVATCDVLRSGVESVIVDLKNDDCDKHPSSALWFERALDPPAPSEEDSITQPAPAHTTDASVATQGSSTSPRTSDATRGGDRDGIASRRRKHHLRGGSGNRFSHDDGWR